MKRYVRSATSPKDYNAKQTQVGSTLKTLNGSAIKRSSKYGVGKEIGGSIYLHKDYMHDIIPEDILNHALELLDRYWSDLYFNTIKWSPAKNTITFQECPDFDSAREPKVGDYVIINYDTDGMKKGHSDYIFHHKWLWVKNDYDGFNVADSWNWSKTWLSVLTEPSDGNGIDRWNAQLARFGLK